MSQKKRYCDHDAFLSSKPINNKVFLAPYKSAERIGDWYENSGYCAAHCAEMVTIQSAEENTHLVNFMRSTGMKKGVWLGATIFNKQDFTHWYSGAPVTYTHPKDVNEYNEEDLTPLLTGFGNKSLWGNWYFTEPGISIACQRPAEWRLWE